MKEQSAHGGRRDQIEHKSRSAPLMKKHGHQRGIGNSQKHESFDREVGTPIVLSATKTSITVLRKKGIRTVKGKQEYRSAEKSVHSLFQKGGPCWFAKENWRELK